MRLVKARILRGSQAASGTSMSASVPASVPASETLLDTDLTLHRARRVPKEVVDAAEQGEQLIRDAEARAHALLQQAERRATEIHLQAQTQGRADAVAELAARFLALRSRELDSQQRGLQQQIELAKLLAQRLLGEELSLHPERITGLARQALREASGARNITIEAHPQDAPLLEQSLESLGVTRGSATIRPNPQRGRGDLLVITEAGTLDAALAPQLERLAAKLKETLNS